MKGIFYSILSLICTCSLTACNTFGNDYAVPSGGAYVNIVNHVSASCAYRGDVSSGSLESMPIGSHEAIRAHQYNVLRGRAYHLGANTVVLTSQSPATYYGQYIISTGQMNYGLDAHAITGRAYYCPGYVHHYRHYR